VPADQLTAPLSLTLGVRPARGLILVPEIEGLPWMRAFEAAIASQVRCWGGGQSIVLPYSDTIADNALFWALLDRADPDQIRVYTGSVVEMEELDPEWFEAARQAQEAQLADLPGEHATHWEDWRQLQLVEYAIPAALRDEVTRRVAPLQLPGWEDWIWTNDATEPLEPFTDVTLFRDLPPTVTDVSRANLSDLERLLLTVEVGRLPPAMREALVARGVDVQIEELAGAGPASFRRKVPSMAGLRGLLESANELRVDVIAQEPFCVDLSRGDLKKTYHEACERGFDHLPVRDPYVKMRR
jgi:hypothetical protein